MTHFRFYVTDGVQRLCALMELKEEYDEEYGNASLVNPYDKVRKDKRTPPPKQSNNSNDRSPYPCPRIIAQPATISR